LKLEE